MSKWVAAWGMTAFVTAGSLAALSVSSAATQSGKTSPSPTKPGRERTAAILAINDVYRIEGLDGGKVGGFARLRTLRARLEKEFPDLVFLHGGDFLFPSFASRLYRGEQMIAVMNALDGDPASFDRRMFVTFGNHEFERPRLRDVSVLQSRIAESQFQWLGGNITFKTAADGSPLVKGANLSRTALVESGGIRIGIFGLTIPTAGVEYVGEFAPEIASARALTAELRAQKAEVVVALTHLNASADHAILERLGDSGPDLIVGGHDHERMASEVNGRFFLKADADARTATVIRLTIGADGRLKVRHAFEKITETAHAADPTVQKIVDSWQTRHEREFCASQKAGSDCLEEVYGRTTTELVAEENRIRGSETSLGDWIADRMLAAFKPCGAQVAFINSGSLRINRDLPPGPVTRRAIEEIFQYEAPLHLVKIDGATLMKVADQSVRGWPGSGTWLQVAGFGFRHDTTARRAHSLTWLSGSSRPVSPDEPVLAVTGDYLVNPEAGDQDGYVMLNKSQIVTDCGVRIADLKTLIAQELRAAEPAGIAPVAEGRICQGVAGEPCRVPAR